MVERWKKINQRKQMSTDLSNLDEKIFEAKKRETELKQTLEQLKRNVARLTGNIQNLECFKPKVEGFLKRQIYNTIKKIKRFDEIKVDGMGF